MNGPLLNEEGAFLFHILKGEDHWKKSDFLGDGFVLWMTCCVEEQAESQACDFRETRKRLPRKIQKGGML
jgi:hypothetical protein